MTVEADLEVNIDDNDLNFLGTETTMFWTSSHTEQEHVGRENKDVWKY